MFEHVFSPLKVRGLELKNRLIMPPMFTGLGSDGSGLTSRMKDYYVPRALGGVGLIIQEATSVRHDGLGDVSWLGIWDDSFVPGWRELVDAVHEAGAKMAIQLHHAGRQISSSVIGQQPVAPSAVTCSRFPEVPRVLTVPEIVALEDAFAEAAQRAMAAGYDAVELHGAHGYLFEQFLSPATNFRDDEYGGDFERRLLFSMNVITKVRKAIGDKVPLSFRISADEMVEGGYDLAGAQAIVPHLIATGADIIHVSVARPSVPGGIIIAPMALPQGCLLHLAAGIKQVSTVPVIAVGRIVDVEMAEDVLASGRADLVAMGRAIVADPKYPNKAREGRLDEINHCIGCRQGCTKKPIQCMVNVTVGQEAELALTPAHRAKKVVVVGGGPGGLEAARVAALRGHKVTLIEREQALGGRLRIGSVPPTKSELGRFVDYLDGQVKKAGVEVRLGEAATGSNLASLGADAVIVATGGDPIVPEQPGMDRPQVVVAEDVLVRGTQVGQRVIVMGAGMTGCEVAEHLAAKGKNVTVVTRVASVREIARDVVAPSRYYLLERLRERGVEIVTGTALEAVGEREVTVRHGQETAHLPADTVVLAQGYRPNKRIAEELSGTKVPVFVIGDAAECRTALEAVREGYEVARKL